MRLRLIDGGQGPAAKGSTDLEPDPLGDEATVITPIPVLFQEQPPDPDFDDDAEPELDVATVLVRGSQLPIELPPKAPEFRSSSPSLPPPPAPEFRNSAPSIPPPEFRSSSPSIPPMYPPEFRTSSESIPPPYPTHPSQQYLAYPYPPQQVVAAPPGRGRVLLALAMGGVLVAGGLTLGWVLFGNSDDEPTAVTTTTTAPPAQAPVPSPPPPIAPPPEPPPSEPPKPAVVAPQPAAITSLVHPTIVAVTSPISGQVTSIEIRTPREVKPGTPLLGVRGSAVRNSQTNALARKVAELEILARQDPASYQPFLARTRRELAIAQRPDLVSIKASVAGVFEARVKMGDKVAAGAQVGAMVDLQVWHASAIVSGAAPLASWSCVVATPDASHSAACKILTTEAVADAGTRVTVEIQASGTEWLNDATQQPRIIVDPASAR